MENLNQRLTSKKIDIDHLYLDPNNRRLLGFGERAGNIPEDRFTDKDVRENAFQEMLTVSGVDVKQLKNSIKHNGFLQIDKLVVRKIQGMEDDYVVVEGNRRLAAIKSVLKDQKRGVIDLDESIIQTLQTVDVLELKGSSEQLEKDRDTIQGIRHIAGVKGWKPYSQAQAVVTKRAEGLTKRETGEALGGLSATKVGWLEKSYYAYNQMKDNEEFGQFAEPSVFSYFVEAIKKPVIRDSFLKWNDNKKRFVNEKDLDLFYQWITPSDELDGGKKIPQAIDLRRLAKVLRDKSAREAFEDEPTLLISQVSLSTGPRIPDWRKEVNEAKDALKIVPLGEDFKEEDVGLLESIVKLANKLLNRIKLHREAEAETD